MNSDEHPTGFTIFVSYSRADADIVESVVKILRVPGTSVFLDKDCIPVGAKWRGEIVSAIESCVWVIVFWCRHANSSSEIESEYQRAIDLDKGIVPILLDATPLPINLSHYQGIDFRPLLGKHEEKELTLGSGRGGGSLWRYTLQQPSAEAIEHAGNALKAQLLKIFDAPEGDA